VGYYESKVETDMAALELDTDVVALKLEMGAAALDLETEIDVSHEI
jgi:hypothetical protein